MKRMRLSESLKTTLRGFLEMTMGDVDEMGAAYMRTYLAEMLLKSDQIYVPEKGAGELTHALADACGAEVRVSTPVNKVIVQDGAVRSVLLDDGPIEADAVICATSASKVSGIIPDLPNGIRSALGTVQYSRGCPGGDRPRPSARFPKDGTAHCIPKTKRPCCWIDPSTCPLPRRRACTPSTCSSAVTAPRNCFPWEMRRSNAGCWQTRAGTPPPGSNLPGDDEGLFTRVYRWPEGRVHGLARHVQDDCGNASSTQTRCPESLSGGRLHADSLCERRPGQRRRRSRRGCGVAFRSLKATCNFQYGFSPSGPIAGSE